ncbi:MAG: heme-copper oxidase subunit III [Acidimicrobiales bacterium]
MTTITMQTLRLMLLTKEPPLADSKLSEATPAEATETVTEHTVEHGTTTGISNNKLLMWAFLGSECLLFGALISTYLLYKERFNDFAANLAPFEQDGRNIGPRFGGEDGEGVFDIPFTSISSFILLGSSLTMVLALSAIRRSEYRSFRIWTLTTAALGSVFIAGQIYEFTEFVEKGLGYSTNIFGSAFFTLTGFHGVHVSIGIVMLLATYIMHKQGRLNSDKAETVEIVGLYWHFVDVVWILIFTIVYLFPQ